MMTRFLKLSIFLALIAACAAPIQPTPVPPTPTIAPPATVPPPTLTLPTRTLPPQPTVAPTIPPVTETPVPAPAGGKTVKLFFIALEDGGKSGKLIGCDDSAVPVDVEIPDTPGVLKAALEALLAAHDLHYGQSGLYNALYQSDLTVDEVNLKDGEVIIRLSGTLLSGGVCDDPRIIAQFEETALQFSTVKKVSVFVNDLPLGQLLSGTGY